MSEPLYDFPIHLDNWLLYQFYNLKFRIAVSREIEVNTWKYVAHVWVKGTLIVSQHLVNCVTVINETHMACVHI